MSRPIDQAVLAVLSSGRCHGNMFYLPSEQLDRALYTAVNKVLTALGGSWSRKAKAHTFAMTSAETVIESAIETGTYARPADLGWFPTPPELAKYVAELACIIRGQRVLEPSAGDGALVNACADYTDHIDMVELDQTRADLLDLRFRADARLKACEISAGKDFLQLPAHPVYDRVVMNPPFAKRADIHHVRHAYEFLCKGGLLVAVMSGSIVWRQDRLAVELREACTNVIPLPEGSFKASGTDVNTAVVVIRK